MNASNPNRNVVLGCDLLEHRTMPARMVGGNLEIVGLSSADMVEVWDTTVSGRATLRIRENGVVQDFSKTAVTQIRFWGNGSNDTFLNYGSHGCYVDGGDGNDAVTGGTGRDILLGSNGNDTLLGGNGDDELQGGNDNDQLNGQAGNDLTFGGAGNDVLIAIDGGGGDEVQPQGGFDVVWVDPGERVFGMESGERLQTVSSFRNGPDRTLNGDRVVDPTLIPKDADGKLYNHRYQQFSGRPLFNNSAPSVNDIKQGAVGDCWLLAGLGAIALDSPNTLRTNIVDFNDGTYGVRLGNNFYRVDNDVAVTPSGDTAYAGFGQGNAMWAIIAEKAYAHFRTGANTYASLDNGWTIDVNRAFGSTVASSKSFAAYGTAKAMADDIAKRYRNYEAVTLGFDGDKKKPTATGAPIVLGHAYTVVGIVTNSAGVVTGITIRNPWGYDGAGSTDSNTSDGRVTVTPALLFAIAGNVTWGKM